VPDADDIQFLGADKGSGGPEDGSDLDERGKGKLAGPEDERETTCSFGGS
jgi:hypothetical protein